MERTAHPFITARKVLPPCESLLFHAASKLLISAHSCQPQSYLPRTHPSPLDKVFQNQVETLCHDQ